MRLFKRKHDPRCRYCGIAKSEAYRKLSDVLCSGPNRSIHTFDLSVDVSDRNVRAKLSKHYQREWSKQVRRNRWRERWRWMNTPYFALIDMLMLALTAALLGTLVGYVVTSFYA